MLTFCSTIVECGLTSFLMKIQESYLTCAFLQIYDYVNSELEHNKTYAYRLPPTFIEQAQGFVDFHEYGVFHSKEMGGIGNSEF